MTETTQPFHIDKPSLLYIKDRQLLMVRTKGIKIFYFIGGSREVGETDADCIKRELMEELNVELVDASLKKLLDHTAQASDQAEGVIIKYAFYLGEIKGQPTPSSEIEEMRYFTSIDYERQDPSVGVAVNKLKELDLID